MDSLIILKLLPLYLLIDSLLSVNPGGEGGARFSTTTLCQVPTWRFRQLTGLKSTSRLQVYSGGAQSDF